MAAYDLSSIAEYVDKDGQIFGAILKGMQSADLWQVYPDTLSYREVPVISDTMYLLENGTLPLSMDTGTTVYGKMLLDPIDLGTVRGYGAADFNRYFPMYQSSPQLEQGLPFEAFVYDFVTTNFMQSYEDKMFNHATKGLVKALYNVSAQTTNITYSAITSTNGEAVVNKYWTSKPAILAGEKCDLVVSMADFENYVLALSLGNKFDSAAFASNVRGNSYTVPGTAGLLTIRGYHALNNKSVAFLTNEKNFGWGYGSEQDWNAQQFEYDLNSDKRIYRIKTKMSVGVHVPAQVLIAV